MSTSHSGVCPVCSGPWQNDRHILRQHKDSINTRLSRLTNPPQPLHVFLEKATPILAEYGLEHTLCEVPEITDNDPNSLDVVIPEWGCILTLQWCYSKMEVAYLS